MAFKDNIGVVEELKVELEECSPTTAILNVERKWIEDLAVSLENLRNPMNPRERLEEIIRDVKQVLNG